MAKPPKFFDIFGPGKPGTRPAAIHAVSNPLGLAEALRRMQAAGLGLEEAADFLDAIEVAQRVSLTAALRVAVDRGYPPDLLALAVEIAEANRAAPRQLYQRAPRTKPYGPASDPWAYWSPEKQRAFSYAEKFVTGAPVARLPDREWWPLVGQVKRRDGFVCTYCGADDRYVLHCDHIVPISRGGPNLIENLTTACEYCNSAKRDRLPQEWLA